MTSDVDIMGFSRWPLQWFEVKYYWPTDQGSVPTWFSGMDFMGEMEAETGIRLVEVNTPSTPAAPASIAAAITTCNTEGGPNTNGRMRIGFIGYSSDAASPHWGGSYFWAVGDNGDVNYSYSVRHHEMNHGRGHAHGSDDAPLRITGTSGGSRFVYQDGKVHHDATERLDMDRLRIGRQSTVRSLRGLWRHGGPWNGAKRSAPWNKGRYP